jgi:hypothetical protein
MARRQFSSEYFGFLCHFSFHQILHTYISSRTGTIGQLVADVGYQVDSVSPHPTKLKKNRRYLQRNKGTCNRNTKFTQSVHVIDCKSATNNGLPNNKWFRFQNKVLTEIRIERVRNVFAPYYLSICPAVNWSMQHKHTVLEPHQFHTFLRYLLGVVCNHLKDYKEYLVSTLRKVFSTRFAFRL